MRSYVTMKLKSGKWAVVEKRYMVVIAKADTREEIIEKLKAIKEADKKEATERKAHKEEVKKLSNEFMENLKDGIPYRGMTKEGKRYAMYRNHGLEERSRHCFSLDIEGMGTVFTSGKIEKVVEYILNN